MVWTDENIELLTNLWRSGWSASQISQKLDGASRNAVLGKIYRLRLGGGEERARGRTNAPSGARRLPSAPRRTAMPIVAAPSCEAAEGPGLATIVTLEAHMCRWPIGDPATREFTFCGRAAAGVYCDAHRTAAYTRRRIARPRT